MKTLGKCALVCAIAFSSYLPIAAKSADHLSFNVDSGDRPIGIDAKDWISVSDKLGFAIVTTLQPSIDNNIYVRPRDERPLLVPSTHSPAPAVGYFMVKTTDGWRRLVAMTPADIPVEKH